MTKPCVECGKPSSRKVSNYYVCVDHESCNCGGPNCRWCGYQRRKKALDKRWRKMMPIAIKDLGDKFFAWWSCGGGVRAYGFIEKLSYYRFGPETKAKIDPLKRWPEWYPSQHRRTIESLGLSVLGHDEVGRLSWSESFDVHEYVVKVSTDDACDHVAQQTAWEDEEC